MISRRTATQVGVVLLIMLSFWYSHSLGINAATQQNCKDIQEIKIGALGYIESNIDRAKTSLPSNPYYAENPIELGKALVELDIQLEEARKVFKVGDC